MVYDMIRLPAPVMIDPRATVVGYDPRAGQPVLDMAGAITLLSKVERDAWDHDEDPRFDAAQIKRIYMAVDHLRPAGIAPPAPTFVRHDFTPRRLPVTPSDSFKNWGF